MKVLDLMTPEPGSFTIMDREYLDFERLYSLTQAERSLSSARKPTRFFSAFIRNHR